jgi:protein SCO1/2
VKLTRVLFSYLFIVLACFSCKDKYVKQSLPYLGNPIIQNKDTLYPKIADFNFINQDSISVSNKTFEGKIYIADFIFLSCPTICPKMNEMMLYAYQKFKQDERVLFLSHTIDPNNDSIPLLKKYAQSIGVDSKKWFFVTGKEKDIYDLAEKSYYAIANKDSLAPGGYKHSGGLLLIDKNQHIRGVYDGTISSENERLVNDITILLKEQF